MADKMASEELPLCVCGVETGIDRFMIECDVCKTWYHGDCVNICEYEAPDIEKYHCPRCAPMFGPPTFHSPANLHRHDCNERNAEKKPVQTGTAVFIKELKSRHFPSADSVVLRLRGPQITLQYLHQNGFDLPILIEDRDGLEIKLPPDDFSLRDIERYLGRDRELDVIDVGRQADLRMKLCDLIHYYQQPVRRRIFNVISLEFSKTPMSELVEAPYIARKMDWVNYVWPDDDTECEKPKVQKYCLIGAKDSYTDFHVDFGGTSVWYHILRGEKVFYLIKPTQANLSLYQRWMTSSTQHDMFFGDQVDACYRLVVRRGNTLLIPTGWIHAVLTPSDTIVFGGNFLHSFNIPLQIQVYETERKMNTPLKYLFPAFERINWYAGERLVQELHDCRSSNSPKYMTTLLTGAKALVGALKMWNVRRVGEESPATVNCHKLLKDLAKEIRYTERYYNQLWPPKPERESKRQKRKPMDKDFVDFSAIKDEQLRMSPKSVRKDNIGVGPPPLKVVNMSSSLMSLSKTESGDSQDSSDSTSSRPRLKLTLPKPAMYPYTSVPSPGSISSVQSAVHSPASDPNVISVKMSPLSSNSQDSIIAHASPKWNKKLHSDVKEDFKTEVQQDTSRVFIDNPNTPTALHRGGTILRFKFGPKDSTGAQKQLRTSLNDSVYDFHDDSDDGALTIDEKPKKGRPHHNVNSGNLNPEVFAADMEVAGEVDVISDTPKNGIEELLKASCYALESTDDVESGRASPSTREAIAGMLSIGRSFMGNQEALPNRPHPQRPKVHIPVRSQIQQLAEDLGEPMDKVHQDDDYIYPSLDASDEEDAVFKPRGKRPMDEAWNPKARVGPVGPKVARPAREGAKKQSVEKGLEAAAAKRAGLPPPKRPYNRKTPKAPVDSLKPAPVAATPSTSTASSAAPSTAANVVQAPGRPSQPAAKAAVATSKSVKVKSHKKGMATAKQRLGKILKIHKMIY